MSNIKVAFEKELKTRLAQKAKPNQPEDALLIKALKFFDLNNSGTICRDEFAKALDRLGVNSYSSEVSFVISMTLRFPCSNFLNCSQFMTLIKVVSSITRNLLLYCLEHPEVQRNSINYFFSHFLNRI